MGVEGPEGRLKCENPPPPQPPALPPPTSPAASIIDLDNIFDIAAIVVAALLTIPLILTAGKSCVSRFNRATVTPKGGEGPGDQEIEHAYDRGRASRGRADRTQDK